MSSQLIISKISHPRLIEQARLLKNHGTVVQQSNYHFLKIDDDFIHRLHPFLLDIPKPNYFTSAQDIGAHITIVYPEEGMILASSDIGQTHTFTVQEFCKATLDSKEYYVLMVGSDSLMELRLKYGLAAQPKYKNNRIQFHITIASQKKISL